MNIQEVASQRKVLHLYNAFDNKQKPQLIYIIIDYEHSNTWIDVLLFIYLISI